MSGTKTQRDKNSQKFYKFFTRILHADAIIFLTNDLSNEATIIFRWQ